MSRLWRTDGRTNGGKWKIEQCSVGPETAIYVLYMYYFLCKLMNFNLSSPTVFITFSISALSSIQNTWSELFFRRRLSSPTPRQDHRVPTQAPHSVLPRSPLRSGSIFFCFKTCSLYLRFSLQYCPRSPGFPPTPRHSPSLLVLSRWPRKREHRSMLCVL